MFADIDSKRCRAHAQMRNFESALEAGADTRPPFSST